MASVGIRALQQNASQVVARAAAGEIVEITDRGRPVARIVPVRVSMLDALILAGEATPATAHFADLPPPLPADPTRPTLSELLQQARADER